VTALKLDGDFIGLSYAAFLSHEEFDGLRPGMKVQFGYDDARALFARFKRFSRALIPPCTSSQFYIREFLRAKT
jgi:hypothetical protein